MHFSYLRYLENYLRKSFDFTGTPVKITARNKKRVTGGCLEMDWMMVLRGAAAVVAGYLIGCISFGYIYRQDI